jgi:hypothetical protein
VRSFVPLDESKAVLDGDTVPAVYHVEGTLPLAQSASHSLVRRDEEPVAHIRLVAQQLLPTIQWRSILTEQANIVRDTYVRPTVPHNVSAMIAHRLHLTTVKQ